MAGITETTNMVDFVIALINAIDKRINGANMATESLAFMSIAFDAWEAFGGIQNLPTELSQMTDDEATQLISHAQQELNVAEDTAKNVINGCLFVAVKCVELYDSIHNPPAPTA